MRKSILLTLSILALALSGCTSEPVETSEAQDNGDAQMTEGNMTVDDLNQTGPFLTLAATAESGTSPILVDITANGLQDEFATFELEMQGQILANGTTDQFPVTVIVDFQYAGEYQINLTATYEDEFGEVPLFETILISLDGEQAPPPVGTLLGSTTFSETGTATLGTQGVEACALPAPADTLSSFNHEIIIPAEFNGKTASVSKFEAQFTNGETAIDIDAYFFNPEGTQIASSAGFELVDGVSESFTISGSFAPGTYVMNVQACAAVAGEYSFDLTATFVSA